MPTSLSAAKRLRQSEKRRLANKARKTELKTLGKLLDRAVHDKEADKAADLYRRLTKRLDQAAAKNVLHANVRSRRKARFAKHMAALSA